MNWTEERIEHLKQLWAKGFSASQIGRELGVSKNAVVGKAHRMKLPARPSPIKRGNARRQSEKGTQAKGRDQGSVDLKEKKAAKPAKKTQVETNKTGVGDKGGDTPETEKKVKRLARSPKGTAAFVSAQPSDRSQSSPPKAARKLGTAPGTDPAIGAQTLAADPKEVARRQKKSEEKSEAADRRFFRGVLAEPRSSRGPKCLWPIGDPGDPDFHFCGAPAVHGKPYCAEHCARAYITKNKGEAMETEEEEKEPEEAVT